MRAIYRLSTGQDQGREGSIMVRRAARYARRLWQRPPDSSSAGTQVAYSNFCSCFTPGVLAVAMRAIAYRVSLDHDDGWRWWEVIARPRGPASRPRTPQVRQSRTHDPKTKAASL